jgi:ribosomal protein L14E/L6E/L27E
MEYSVGQKVRSIAGHDNGTDYIIVRTEDNYVYVADGAIRKLENPKKKKFKHIQGSYNISVEIAAKIADGSIENHMIRKFLNP